MVNDDFILCYYEVEMCYLCEFGKEFVQVYFDCVWLFNFDCVGDCDLYVEWLFEGFVFLIGCFWQKFDDELFELMEGLVSLLWLYYLCMILLLLVVEFILLLEKFQKIEVVLVGVLICFVLIFVLLFVDVEGLLLKIV